MLVLTRKLNEEIVIGNNVRVQVLEIRGGRVRLGISAPVEVPIHRAEVSHRTSTAGARGQSATGHAESDSGFVVCEPIVESYLAYAG